MIYSETIEIVHSNVVNEPVFSEEVPDYRTLDEIIRLTEENEPVKTENDLIRLIE